MIDIVIVSMTAVAVALAFGVMLAMLVDIALTGGKNIKRFMGHKENPFFVDCEEGTEVITSAGQVFPHSAEIKENHEVDAPNKLWTVCFHHDGGTAEVDVDARIFGGVQCFKSGSWDFRMQPEVNNLQTIERLKSEVALNRKISEDAVAHALELSKKYASDFKKIKDDIGSTPIIMPRGGGAGGGFKTSGEGESQ